MTTKTVTIKVDFSLLEQQKNTLIDIIGETKNEKREEDLTGLLHLIDALQDDVKEKDVEDDEAIEDSERTILPPVKKGNHKYKLCMIDTNDSLFDKSKATYEDVVNCCDGNGYGSVVADDIREILDFIVKAYNDEMFEYPYWLILVDQHERKIISK